MAKAKSKRSAGTKRKGALSRDRQQLKEWLAKVPVALEPTCRMVKPNATVPLYQGNLKHGQAGQTRTRRGAVMLKWLPSPRLCFEFDDASASDFECLGQDVRVTVSKYALGGDGLVTSVGDGGVTGVLKGSLETSTPSMLKAIMFMIPNFDDPRGTGVRLGNAICSARQQCQARTWELILDPVKDQSGVFKELRARGGYAFTNVGSIQRVDGNTFKSTEAGALLERLSLFLSFCKGRWSGPMLAEGRNHDGLVTWRHWTTWKLSPWRTTASWLSHEIGPAPLFDGFMDITEDEHSWRVLMAAVHWYVEANDQAGGINGGVILAQAALELLAWHKLVVLDGLLDQQAFEQMTAYSKIRTLLRACGIPIEVPAGLGSRVSGSKIKAADGVEFTTLVRNRLVHPPRKNKKYERHASDEIFAAWTFGLWAIELVLLRLCAYQDRYCDRTDRGRLGAGEKLVPWVPEPPTSAAAPVVP